MNTDTINTNNKPPEIPPTETTPTPEEPKKSKWSWKRIKDLWTKVKSYYKTTIKFVASIIFVVLVYQTIVELIWPRPVFEPFEVPKSLESQGYTGKVVVYRLLDQIKTLRRQAQQTARYSTIGRSVGDLRAETQASFQTEEPEQPLNIELPGTGLSLNTIINYIMRILGFESNRKRISGDIVVREQQLDLTVRITTKSAKTYSGHCKINRLQNYSNPLMRIKLRRAKACFSSAT